MTPKPGFRILPIGAEPASAQRSPENRAAQQPRSEGATAPRTTEVPSSGQPAAKSAAPNLRSGPAPGGSAIATGGLFPNAATALSFLGAIAGAGLADHASARRSDKGSYWVEVMVEPTIAVPLVYTAGGHPFGTDLPDLEVWMEAFPDGRVPPAKMKPAKGSITLICGEERHHLAPPKWQEVGLRELLHHTALVQTPLRAHDVVCVFVLSPLARWVLQRATTLDLDVELAAAQRVPLHGGSAAEGGVWMRMRGRRRSVSAAWLKALTDLPGTVVARAAGDPDSRLWVDVRYRIPVSVTLFAAMVPEQETWLLGGSDSGHFVVSWKKFVPGSSLIALPTEPIVVPQLGGGSALPKPVAVKLERMPTAPAAGADALLLDDTELNWLVRFLLARPLSARTYLISGGGQHLVFVLGGVVERIPFGLPLTHLGPGPIYLQQGTQFSPPLPEEARVKAFMTAQKIGDGAPEDPVVLTLSGALRFSAKHLAPAWTLWLGEVPEVRTTNGHSSTSRLKEIFGQLDQHHAEKPALMEHRQSLPSPLPAADDNERRRLRDEAMREVSVGQFLSAAEKLERAGDLAEAGVYYERAAAALPQLRVQRSVQRRTRKPE